MIAIEQTRNYLCLVEEGSEEIRHEGYQFFNDLARETIVRLKKYFDLQPEDWKEHAFEYREQQIKTYLTLALGKLTNGNVMQEFPMERVKKRTKKREDIGRGFVDYWAATDELTCFIEVKRRWTRYYPNENTFRFYQIAADELSNAKSQTDQIKYKSSFYHTRHAYSLGLLITPVFAYGDEARIIRMDDVLKEQLVQGAKKFGADAAAFWRIGNGRLHAYESGDEDLVEYYPGVVFWGKVRKVSRG